MDSKQTQALLAEAEDYPTAMVQCEHPGDTAALIRRLASALRAALEDSERLDWLSRGGALPLISQVGGCWGAFRDGPTNYQWVFGDTLRAAIDAARHPTQEPPNADS